MTTEEIKASGLPADESDASESGRPPPASIFHGFVIAIGASAGGLDALERLFGALPADSGAAFVVVQHLSPDHKSMMDNLLSRYTAMPVRVVEHGMPLSANAVFLIPPGKSMRLAGERLLLSPKPEHGLSLPIDIFFNSLAEQCADRALAVVLSGTGSDGSRGVVAVNAGGGFVFVQDPSTAKFDGMPRSAIGTGLVDVVASAEVLAQRLIEQIQAPRETAMRLLGGDNLAAQAQPLDGILERLVASSGIDFREYKPTTVLRRIERRMQVLRASSLADYHERLTGSLDEQSLLRRELLIPVTRFFRDNESFEHLAETVVKALVEQERNFEPIRMWVACCATGEEAYSMAILFAEAFARLGRSRPVKIFATDVEQQYLDHAAAGLYSDTIAAEVSAERLERCFLPRPNGFVVRPEIRQMVIFARHNLVGDPPFTRMDVVSCRNALIYFQPIAQERALRRLQYALLPGGHLFLGPSESLGVLHRDFSSPQGRHKVYRLLRRERLSIALDTAGRHLPTAKRHSARRVVAAAALDATPWVLAGQRELQSNYLPPSLLVSASRELLHVYGSGRELLQFTEGQATLDVLKLLPSELSWAAGLLLQAVAVDRKPQRSGALRFSKTQAEGDHRVRLVVRPVGAGDGAANAAGVADPVSAQAADQAGLVLISFETVIDSAAAQSAPADMPALDAAQQRRMEALERELDITHDSLQATIEELETANEELQATNEELMASNEELQSTNEELQSVNEELYTVNSEFQEKVDVLNSVNADLENIAKASAIPTLFVDDELRLTRFTPELAQLFKVRSSDTGRSIEDFANLLDYPDLFADLRRTLAGGVITEREVRSRTGEWWLSRIQPYGARTPGSARAVMTFVNVTSLKDSQRLQAVIDSLAEHVAVVDSQGCITLVNEAWRRFASNNSGGAADNGGPGSNYLQVCERAAPHDADAQRAYEGLRGVLDGSLSDFTLQYPCDTASKKLWFLMHVGPVKHPAGGAVVSHIDITSWVHGTLRQAAS